MRMQALVVLLLTVFVSASSAQYSGVFGLDVSSGISGTISASNWACLNSNGYQFAVIEGWQGGYGLNSNLGSAASLALAANFSVDVYSFMCPRCSGNGPSGVQTLVNYLTSKSISFGTVWIDVEQCTGCWYSTLDSNCGWLGSIVQTYQNLGVNIGIYSSNYEWGATVGSACNNYTSLPLWYAHYDGSPSFSDWSSTQFGGWSSPAIKQFADSAGNSCGISIDRDWHQ